MRWRVGGIAMADKALVVTACEGCAEDVLEFDNELYARGFCAGFSAGAGHYGAGSAIAVIWDTDGQSEMKDASEFSAGLFKDCQNAVLRHKSDPE